MPFNRNADSTKKTWRNRLELLSLRFNKVKPKESDEKALAAWNTWGDKIQKLHRSINIFTTTDGEAYTRITRTINAFDTYIQQRQQAVATANRKAKQDEFRRHWDETHKNEKIVEPTAEETVSVQQPARSLFAKLFCPRTTPPQQVAPETSSPTNS